MVESDPDSNSLIKNSFLRHLNMLSVGISLSSHWRIDSADLRGPDSTMEPRRELRRNSVEPQSLQGRPWECFVRLLKAERLGLAAPEIRMCGQKLRSSTRPRGHLCWRKATRPPRDSQCVWPGSASGRPPTIHPSETHPHPQGPPL